MKQYKTSLNKLHLSSLLVPLDVLLGKKLGDLNVHEAISIFFHAIQKMRLIDDSEDWEKLYLNFAEEVQTHRDISSCELHLFLHEEGNRHVIPKAGFSTMPYQRSNNILTILLYLTHIEVSKEAKYGPEKHKYRGKVKFPFNKRLLSKGVGPIGVEEATLKQIMDSLRLYLDIYKTSFKRDDIEHGMAEAILSKI